GELFAESFVERGMKVYHGHYFDSERISLIVSDFLRHVLASEILW
ncbi:9979_t:CDS:1, partial [Dentiscutata heterogama]